MPVEPIIRAFLDQLPDEVEGSTLDHLEMRARLEANAPVSSIDLPRMEDLVIDGPGGPLALRLYGPVAASAGARPAMVWLHGGGFVIGSIQTDDATCREMALDADIVIVSVEYRLAPEHPFPAAVEDALAAVRWAAANAASLGIDADRLAVGGGSAGGNLAAVTALRARDEGGPSLVYQLLVNPSCDTDSAGYPSMTENATGYMLTRNVMQWFHDQYLPEGLDRTEPFAAPIRAKSLAGLPRSQVVTAEFDPLRDEAEAYARRLADDGVEVALRPCPGGIHGFLGYRDLVPAARRAFDDMVADLGAGLRA